jgi:uncharacterized membrane protein YgcG
MVSRTEWIDVRTLEVNGQPVTGVIHYTLAPSDVAEAAGFGNIAAEQALAVRAARVAASGSLTVEDVIDAHRFVGQEVVRSWIAERRQPFQLDADRLVRMADSGVPPDVIDVVVAVSYPRYFNIGEGAQVSQNGLQAAGAENEPLGRGWGFGRRGMFWNPMYRGYGRYYYGDYYYNDYYYGYGGFSGYPGIYRPTIVVVEPRDPEPAGRVVNGRGYTRSGSRPSAASDGGSSRNSGGASSPPSSSSSEGSGSSGGGTSTGRTAQPRNNPGG